MGISRKFGLTVFVIGIIMYALQVVFALYFLVPLMNLAYPSASDAVIANASGVAAVATSIALIIAGVVIFFIGRREDT